MSGRIRTFKPELLEDEKTAGLTDAEFRLFAAIVLLSDDHGNTRANPKWLTSQVWWRRRPSGDPSKAFVTLTQIGLVTPYEANGQHYVHVTNWDKHQRIDKPSKPRVPGPIEPKDIPTLSNDSSRDTRETLATLPLDSVETPAKDSREGPPISDQGHGSEKERASAPKVESYEPEQSKSARTRIDLTWQPKAPTVDLLRMNAGLSEKQVRDEVLPFASHYSAALTDTGEHYASDNWDAWFVKWCSNGRGRIQRDAEKAAKERRPARAGPHTQHDSTTNQSWKATSEAEAWERKQEEKKHAAQ